MRGASVSGRQRDLGTSRALRPAQDVRPVPDEAHVKRERGLREVVVATPPCVDDLRATEVESRSDLRSAHQLRNIEASPHS
jgi:hypothetical protein